jgi:hypothetical protein
MIAGRNELLSFAKNVHELKSLKELVLSTAKEVAKQPNSKSENLLCELLELAVKKTNLSKLKILEIIHPLVENNKLIQIQNSGLIKFRLGKTTPEFERRQLKLQEAYSRRTEDVGPVWHTNLKEEGKEIKEFEKVIFPQEEQQRSLRLAKDQAAEHSKFTKRSRRKKGWRKKESAAAATSTEKEHRGDN